MTGHSDGPQWCQSVSSALFSVPADWTDTGAELRLRVHQRAPQSREETDGEKRDRGRGSTGGEWVRAGLGKQFHGWVSQFLKQSSVIPGAMRTPTSKHPNSEVNRVREKTNVSCLTRKCNWSIKINVFYEKKKSSD